MMADVVEKEGLGVLNEIQRFVPMRDKGSSLFAFEINMHAQTRRVCMFIMELGEISVSQQLSNVYSSLYSVYIW